MMASILFTKCLQIYSYVARLGFYKTFESFDLTFDLKLEHLVKGSVYL